MKQPPRILSNMLSLIGLVIVVFNIGLIVFLSIINATSAGTHPYADLIIWILLPAIVLFGVVLIVSGLRRQRKKELAGEPSEGRFPVMDFNDPMIRKKGLILLIVILPLSMLYAFSGYKFYEFSESNKFCGSCHSVMGPETRSNHYSSHAKVSCTTCHVGPGAKYYFIAHLRGAKEGLALLLGSYSRPIHTPVKDLRPSQDICENCHGPKYQLNQRMEGRTYYMSDKQNSLKKINLLLRMGKAEITMEKPPKMHWHSGTTEEIDYSTQDPKRIDIPWVRAKRLDGKVRVYRSIDSKLSDDEAAKIGTRRMDCMDCHNRSGHPTNPPALILNAMLGAGLIDPHLPDIKHLGVQILETSYASRDEAHKGIEKVITEFYAKAYPAVAKDKGVAITAAIKSLQGAYDRNYDAYMKVSWRHYGNNQGHVFAQGCFRCHDGKHRTDDGLILSRDCNLCHLLVERAPGQDDTVNTQALLRVMEYPHPVDVGDSWKQTMCITCHGPSS
ncbi:MAG: Cytochrome c family protein [Deltaproteobacteria bacterium]|nr:Cytochrome c family protein [Deltaproteobacteria bacterium]